MKHLFRKIAFVAITCVVLVSCSETEDTKFNSSQSSVTTKSRSAGPETFINDDLIYETTMLETESQNVIRNSIVIKDLEERVLVNLTTVVTANDPEIDLYSEQLPEDMDLSVEMYEGETLVYTGAFVDGIMAPGTSRMAPNHPTALYPCSFSGNLQCVDDHITAMNCVDYVFCLASATKCYIKLWASCIHDNCYGH